MIIVSVQLVSARSGQTTELARMHIANDGTGTERVGNYAGKTLRGRSTAQLDKATTQHTGRVRGFNRGSLHVWNLVARMLKDMGYG